MKKQSTVSKCQQKKKMLELDHQGRWKWNYQEQNKNSYVLNTYRGERGNRKHKRKHKMIKKTQTVWTTKYNI